MFYRRRTRNGKQITMALLTAVFLLVLVMVTSKLIADHHDLMRLAQEGHGVTVQVAARSIDIFGRHYLEYEGHTSNQYIAGMDIVSEMAYRNTPSWSEMAATYVPADPNLIQLGTVTQAEVVVDLYRKLRAFSYLTLFFASILGAGWYFYARPRSIRAANLP